MRVSIFVAAMLLLPAFASAEVMDKEPTLVGVWSTALLLGVAGLIAWLRRRALIGSIVGLFAVFFIWGLYTELTDPFVGPDILREAGEAYVSQARSALLLCTLLNMLGLGIYMARRIRNGSSVA
jgi:uncharacterized membrane protein YccC